MLMENGEWNSEKKWGDLNESDIRKIGVSEEIREIELSERVEYIYIVVFLVLYFVLF